MAIIKLKGGVGTNISEKRLEHFNMNSKIILGNNVNLNGFKVTIIM